MNTIRAIFGTGGLGREVMEIAKRDLPNGHELIFIEDAPKVALVNDTTVLSVEEFAEVRADKFYCVAVGNPTLRSNIARRLHYRLSGAEPFSIVSARSTIHPTVRLGRGAIVMDGVRISSNAEIGRFFLANYNAIVGHDCQVEDYVTLSPAAGIMGRVSVGECAFLGAGAMVLPRVRIGVAATVGALSLALSNVENGEIAIGIPAKARSQAELSA